MARRTAPVCGGKRPAAGDAPGFVRIALARDEGLLERALAGLAKPFQPAERLHLLFHFRGQREEKMSIVFRVLRHRGRKRAARPVRFLRSLRKGDVEILLHESGETEFLQAEHAGRDHGVENFAHRKIEGAPEQAQIEIHSLQNDLALGQRGAERLEIELGEGIDQDILAIESELDQAQLLEIAVQTVGLGIDRDPFELPEPREDFREL